MITQQFLGWVSFIFCTHLSHPSSLRTTCYYLRPLLLLSTTKMSLMSVYTGSVYSDMPSQLTPFDETMRPYGYGRHLPRQAAVPYGPMMCAGYGSPFCVGGYAPTPPFSAYGAYGGITGGRAYDGGVRDMALWGGRGGYGSTAYSPCGRGVLRRSKSVRDFGRGRWEREDWEWERRVRRREEKRERRRRRRRREMSPGSRLVEACLSRFH